MKVLLLINQAVIFFLLWNLYGIEPKLPESIGETDRTVTVEPLGGDINE